MVNLIVSRTAQLNENVTSNGIETADSILGHIKSTQSSNPLVAVNALNVHLPIGQRVDSTFVSQIFPVQGGYNCVVKFPQGYQKTLDMQISPEYTLCEALLKVAAGDFKVSLIQSGTTPEICFVGQSVSLKGGGLTDIFGSKDSQSSKTPPFKLTPEIKGLVQILEENPRDANAYKRLSRLIPPENAVRVNCEALSCYDCLLRSIHFQPHDADTYLQLANLLKPGQGLPGVYGVKINNEDFTLKRCYQKALELQPALIEVYPLLAGTLNKNEKIIINGYCFDRISLLLKALESQPDNMHLLINLGEALSPGQSILVNKTQISRNTCFVKVFNLNNRKLDASIYNKLGAALQQGEHLHFQNGTSLNAIECFRSALEIDPTLSTAFSNLGQVIHQNGTVKIRAQDYSKIRCFSKAIELDQRNAKAYFLLSSSLQPTETIKIKAQIYDRYKCYRQFLELSGGTVQTISNHKIDSILNDERINNSMNNLSIGHASSNKNPAIASHMSSANLQQSQQQPISSFEPSQSLKNQAQSLLRDDAVIKALCHLQNAFAELGQTYERDTDALQQIDLLNRNTRSINDSIELYLNQHLIEGMLPPHQLQYARSFAHMFKNMYLLSHVMNTGDIMYAQPVKSSVTRQQELNPDTNKTIAYLTYLNSASRILEAAGTAKNGENTIIKNNTLLLGYYIGAEKPEKLLRLAKLFQSPQEAAWMGARLGTCLAVHAVLQQNLNWVAGKNEFQAESSQQPEGMIKNNRESFTRQWQSVQNKSAGTLQNLNLESVNISHSKSIDALALTHMRLLTDTLSDLQIHNPALDKQLDQHLRSIFSGDQTHYSKVVDLLSLIITGVKKS